MCRGRSPDRPAGKGGHCGRPQGSPLRRQTKVFACRGGACPSRGPGKPGPYGERRRFSRVGEGLAPPAERRATARVAPTGRTDDGTDPGPPGDTGTGENRRRELGTAVCACRGRRPRRPGKRNGGPSEGRPLRVVIPRKAARRRRGRMQPRRFSAAVEKRKQKRKRAAFFGHRKVCKRSPTWESVIPAKENGLPRAQGALAMTGRGTAGERSSPLRGKVIRNDR